MILSMNNSEPCGFCLKRPTSSPLMNWHSNVWLTLTRHSMSSGLVREGICRGESWSAEEFLHWWSSDDLSWGVHHEVVGLHQKRQKQLKLDQRDVPRLAELLLLGQSHPQQLQTVNEKTPIKSNVSERLDVSLKAVVEDEKWIRSIRNQHSPLSGLILVAVHSGQSDLASESHQRRSHQWEVPSWPVNWPHKRQAYHETVKAVLNCRPH